MPADDEHFRERLAALTKTFTDGFDARMVGIEAALAQIEDGRALGEQTAPVRGVLEQAHKIAGSAGTFGFGEISALASQIERLCDRILANKQGVDSEALDALRTSVRSLRAMAPK